VINGDLRNTKSVDLGWVDDDDDPEALETRLKSPNGLYEVTLERVLDYIDNEMFAQSLLKLVKEMDEIVPVRDSDNDAQAGVGAWTT
jgi:hypothetical protein